MKTIQYFCVPYVDKDDKHGKWRDYVTVDEKNAKETFNMLREVYPKRLWRIV